MLSRATVVRRVRWHVAAFQVRIAVVRFRLALRAFNPFQPRVPKGNPEGGEWTEDGSRSRRDRARVIRISDDPNRRYGVVLAEEELRGGHTLRDHVGKTDEEMLERVRASRTISTFYRYGRQRHGSFESTASANDFVNRALERHSSDVDRVASGEEKVAFFKERFGYSTGREAYTDGYVEPYVRTTFGVGVLIYHDSSSSRGYRVHTAYPRNDGD